MARDCLIWVTQRPLPSQNTGHLATTTTPGKLTRTKRKQYTTLSLQRPLHHPLYSFHISSLLSCTPLMLAVANNHFSTTANTMAPHRGTYTSKASSRRRTPPNRAILYVKESMVCTDSTLQALRDENKPSALGLSTILNPSPYFEYERSTDEPSQIHRSIILLSARAIIHHLALTHGHPNNVLLYLHWSAGQRR